MKVKHRDRNKNEPLPLSRVSTGMNQRLRLSEVDKAVQTCGVDPR